MLKDLIKMAGRLDSMGLKREADIVDALIQKVAGDFDKPFDSASYIAGRIEPESSLPTSAEEMENLTRLGFSPLNMSENEDLNLERSLAGEYNYNNGCYMVIPHNYPGIGPMIYLRQPGKTTRTYSGYNQDELAKVISRFLDWGRSPYRLDESLPVPGSERLSG